MCAKRKNKNDEHSDHHKPNLVLSIVAICISVAGIAISIFSYNLSKEIYRQERSIILKGISNEEFGEVKITPVESDLYLISGEAIFPTKILEKPAKIENDGELWAMGSIRFGIQDIIKERIPITENSVTMGELNIPISIRSYYSAKGTAYTDVSLYYLRVLFTVSGPNGSLPKLSFLGLTFIDRSKLKDPWTQEKLDEIFQGKGIIVPFRSPLD